MRSDRTVDIAVLLPDLLGTYADGGNAEILAQRSRWRDIPARVLSVEVGHALPTGCDLYVLGGGEDTAQDRAAQWLRRHRGGFAAVAEQAVTLAVCAGMQLLGHATWDRPGTHRSGLGLLDLETHRAPERQIGESVSACHLPAVGDLVGFHNHAGVSLLGSRTAPLGAALRGPANHPDTTDDGAIVGARGAVPHSGAGIVATYMHGPVLARNPALADHLLSRAVGTPLPPLDPTLLPDLPRLRDQYLHHRRRGCRRAWKR